MLDMVRELASVFKFCSLEFAYPLSYMIYLPLKTWIFCIKLKIITITALHKKGSKIDCRNNRPIALISISGFRKNRSTNLTIYHIIMKIVSETLDDKIPVTALFMATTKTFYLVSHNKLLRNLYLHRIWGPAYDLINSYLKNRVQYTKTTYNGAYRIM